MQPMSWTFQTQAGHLLVVAQGEWILNSVLVMIGEVRDQCRQANCDRVLIDMRTMRGLVTEDERYRAGVRVAEKLKDIRFALVPPESYPSRFSEEVANRRGATMRITTDIDDARRWLLAEG